MSTYIDKAINPKTNQVQKAWFIDNYFGHYRYGVAFRKDGNDPIFEEWPDGWDDYEVYRLKEIKTPKDSHTNSPKNN